MVAIDINMNATGWAKAGQQPVPKQQPITRATPHYKRHSKSWHGCKDPLAAVGIQTLKHPTTILKQQSSFPGNTNKHTFVFTKGAVGALSDSCSTANSSAFAAC